MEPRPPPVEEGSVVRDVTAQCNYLNALRERRLPVVERLVAELDATPESSWTPEQCATAAALRTELRDLRANRALTEYLIRVAQFAQRNATLIGDATRAGDVYDEYQREVQPAMPPRKRRLTVKEQRSERSAKLHRNALSQIAQHQCQRCPAGVSLIVDRATATATCPRCAVVQDLGPGDDEGASVGFKDLDRLSFTTRSSYKRINRFREWLTMVQAKQGRPPDAELVAEVRAEFAKIRGLEPSRITPRMVRNTLRQLENRLKLKHKGGAKSRARPRKNVYTCHYDRATQIASLLSGRAPPRFTEDQEQMLMQLFVACQEPFETCPPHILRGRSNFLSSPWTARRFCELLQYDEMIDVFPTLKSPTKNREHNAIWQWICSCNAWEYYPSTVTQPKRAFDDDSEESSSSSEENDAADDASI